MTTLEPGASVVFTHGRRCKPRSTAFLASSAAAIITDGLDVLVHDVIAAMTTAPWSTSVSVPSSIVTLVRADGRSPAGPVGAVTGAPEPLPAPTATGSLAGNVWATPSSTVDVTPNGTAWPGTPGARR